MNWYEHHLGDWLKDVVGLTLAEEGAYLRLVHWYYGHERALPPEEVEVFRCARVGHWREREAVRAVLAQFFTLMPDGWHHSRCDREIARFTLGRPKSEVARLGQNERQRAAREYRSSLFATLRDAGVVPPMKTRNDALVELCRTIGVTAPSRERVTASVTANGHDTLFPLPTSHNTRAASAPLVAVPSPSSTAPSPLLARALAACSLIQAGGIEDTRAADPQLLRLIEAGVTDEMLTLTSVEAKARKRGWPWLMATLKGRMEDGPGKPLERPGEGPSAFMQGLLTHLPANPSQQGDVVPDKRALPGVEGAA